MRHFSNSNRSELILTFSLPEKIIMRTLFYGFIAVGAVALWLVAPLWGMLYMLFSAAGLSVIFFVLFCPYCPYPYAHNTCLFAPPGIIRKLSVFHDRTMPKSALVAAGVISVALIAAPQMALIQNIPLLVAFWILCAIFLVAIPRLYCRCCRNLRCPLNRVADASQNR
jgi:hypothetical protein